MNNIYEFRPYTDKDYWFVYNVKKNAYKVYVELNWGKWDDDAQKEMFVKFIETYGKDIKIIVVDGEDVGFFHGDNLPNNGYEIGNICIIPECQGKGLGTKILKDIILEHKHQDIYLRYFKQNPVVKLYERLGFKMLEELPYHNKMILKTKIMVKE